MVGCKSDFDGFQAEALNFAQNDNKIDEKEYNALTERIKASSDSRFKPFITENKQIDHPKLVDYLVKYFTAKKLSLTAADIWNPDVQPTANSKFNLDVYIENSASMDGYVNGVTDFETAIYNLLGDLKISGLGESMNLNYINKSIPFTKTNALKPDLQDFIERLEPAGFKQKGGDRSTSDLAKILQTVIQKVDDKNTAILVSDFVFSPGSKNNAQDYLNNQSVGIKIDFAEKLKEFDLSVIVIQLQSNFDGTYYDKTNQAIPLKTKRPYYIWFFGSTPQIKAILDSKKLDNLKGGYLNRIVFTPLKKDAPPPEYKISLRPRIGEFKLPGGAKGEITEASVSQEAKTKGIFGFEVAVNFAGGMQNANYFLDPNNYRLSNSNYQLTIERILDGDPTLKGFTHKLKLQTTELREETLKIEIIGKLPSWVTDSTSTDDSRIAADDSEKQKTFGLKHLIEGVNDAFYPQSSENIINTLSISIKK
jgi:hypothetical protein